MYITILYLKVARHDEPIKNHFGNVNIQEIRPILAFNYFIFFCVHIFFFIETGIIVSAAKSIL